MSPSTFGLSKFVNFYLPLLYLIVSGSIFSIGIMNDADGKLSTHRSDYEIHTPDHRDDDKRPQSTAELVSS